MKKVFWWILGILLSPVLLFIILTILLYLPPVQRWAVDKATAVASEETGMQITIDHVRLAFPLDLSLGDLRVIHAPDTIADVERLVVDVRLLPLMTGRVVVNELEVLNTTLNTNGFVDAARIKGRFGRLFVSSKGIDLGQQTVELNGTRLEDAILDIALNDSVPEDTTATEPTTWKIHIDEAAIHRSDITLHMPGDTMHVATHIGTLAVREALIDLENETYTVASVDLENGALQYDNGPQLLANSQQPTANSLDFNHIALSNVTIGIDSIYYHDPTMRLHLRQVALKEKSGLQVTDLSGPVCMEDGSLRLPKFRLKTPHSDIDVELDMPLSLMEPIDPGQMRLRMNAQLGKQDLMVFLADMPRDFRNRWPDQPLTF